MPAPTVEDILSWPQPNYDHPQDPLTPVIYGVNIATMVLMTVFIMGRFYSRTVIVRNSLGADDWTMLIAYVLAMAMSICQVFQTRYGVGRHLYDVRVGWFAEFGKITLAVQAIFGPCAALTKTSICLTYLRLFPSKTNKWFNYIQITILVVFGISTMIAMLLQCVPISDMWNLIKADSDKKCINSEVFFIAVAVVNSGTDFLVYLWPSYYLWNVQLSLAKRVGLIVCFGVGMLICIAGIVRITWQVRYAHSWDQTYNGAIIFVIVAFEVNMGIVCGCLPGIRPLVRKFFPTWNPTSHGSGWGQSSHAQVSSRGMNSKKGYQDMHSIHVTKEVELSVLEKSVEMRERKGTMTGERSDSEEWIFRA